MLKVMSFNMNYYVPKHGAWEIRKEMIHTAVQEARPDILALQAVRKDPLIENGKDQAHQLSALMPEYMQVIFQPAMEYADESQEGSAILARLPVAAHDFLPLTLLPDMEDKNQRVLMHARFDLPGGPLHLFNGHFSWVSEQTDVILDEVLPYMNSFEGPGLLVGDLNTPSDSHLLQRIRQSGWTDAWEALFPGQQGYTFESQNPTIRIDYAWANASLASQVSNVQIVANSSRITGERPSDHLGLLVTLDLQVTEK